MQSGISARTGNTWQRQDYVIETQGQYSRKCQFTVAGDNIALFNLQEGQRIRVTLSLDAHEYNGRWFNDFRAIGIANPDAPQPSPAGLPPIGAPMPESASSHSSNANDALAWEQNQG